MNRFRFVHLNVHSHYSINDGCASIKELVDSAIKDKMPGVAITDNGNMFGVMEFFNYVSRINNERRQKGKKPFKPIIGCELYVAPVAKDVVKNSGNAACKDKRQRLEKGMFIETSTVSPIPPIGVSRERPMLAQLFLNKYGIEVNVQNMNSGYFNCEKIG